MAKFPQALLSSSNEEKIAYFRDVRIEHDLLSVALKRAHNYIATGAPEQIILVCGPSGVGKKELIRSLEQHYSTIRQEEIDVGCVPIASIEAMPAILDGVFDMKTFCKSALRNLQEPLIENKLAYETVTVYDSQGVPYIVSRAKRADYVDSLTSTLHYRKTRVFIVNEAQHMLRLANGKKTNTLVDVIKCIANLSKTVPIVLVGTYELLNLLDGLEAEKIDQMISRIRIIHLPRYNIEVKDEGALFGNIALKMLRSMPLSKSPEYIMDKYWEELFHHTNGCVGALKNWLLDAYTLAVNSNCETLFIKHLEETKTSLHLASTKLASIEAGERRMAKILSDGRNVDAFIPDYQNDNPSSEDSTNEEPNKPQKTKTKHPGERKPHRDAVR